MMLSKAVLLERFDLPSFSRTVPFPFACLVFFLSSLFSFPFSSLPFPSHTPKSKTSQTQLGDLGERCKLSCRVWSKVPADMKYSVF